jgi:RNA polymerase sigma-70 factor, ECF subfamily
MDLGDIERRDVEAAMFGAASPVAPSDDESLDRALTVFLAERRQLEQIAYRVIGSRAEAEDVVQEVWVRWQRTDRRLIRNAAAFLTTTATHLAINVIQSAHSRHTRARPPLVPESVDRAVETTDALERTVAAEHAILLLVSRLGAGERAAYVLRHAFDYPYCQIAAVLQITTGSARQLVHRAQVRIDRGRARDVDQPSYRRLVAAFEAAARTGRMEVVEQVLLADIEQSRGCGGRAGSRNGTRARCDA